MVYAQMFVLKCFGQIKVGPNTGKILVGHEQSLVGVQNLSDAEAHVQTYVGKFVGRMDIWTSQWFDVRPSDCSDWREGLLGGGFCWVKLKEVLL